MICVGCIGFGCVTLLDPHPTVPAEHRRAIVDGSDPTGEAPNERYRLAYESFWWNCLAVKSEDERARCPFMCSGPPAAADGCREGASDAETIVRELTTRLGASKAKQRLQLRVSTPSARQSIRRYFPSGPERERF